MLYKSLVYGDLKGISIVPHLSMLDYLLSKLTEVVQILIATMSVISNIYEWGIGVWRGGGYVNLYLREYTPTRTDL